MKRVGLMFLKNKFRKDRLESTNVPKVKITFKQSEYKDAEIEDYKKNQIKAYEHLAKI